MNGTAANAPVWVEVLRAVVWPLTALILILVFRRPIVGLTEMVRQVEAPGGFKFVLDPKRVEQIIRLGKQENRPEHEIADEIVNAAEIVDVQQLRILRALVDEPAGRQIANYQRYYRAALEALVRDGHVTKEDAKYRLTAKGARAAKHYLQSVLEQQDL
jgi:hypothetical protein